MLVRHDAELEVVIRCNAAGHSKPCSKSIIIAPTLDAHLAISGSYMHGKVSGMDSGIRVRASYKLVNPKRDVLKNGELCPCKDCVN